MVVPQFGDAERDNLACEALAKSFPSREIVPLRIDAIANSGGGIHCLTQAMPDFQDADDRDHCER
jgi:agmatine deiminase